MKNLQELDSVELTDINGGYNFLESIAYGLGWLSGNTKPAGHNTTTVYSEGLWP